MIQNSLYKENKKEKEKQNEMNLLLKIQQLTPELIYIIYNFLPFRPKLICNKKYDLLKSIIKDDCFREYCFCNYLKSVFDPMSKNQILFFLKNGSLKHHPSIINRIWYFSNITNNYYDKENLIKLWSGDIVDPVFENENKDYINYILKIRVIDAIYYYFLRTIEIYERNKYKCLHLNLNINSDLNSDTKLKYHKTFKNIDIDKLFYLYKSFQYLNN